MPHEGADASVHANRWKPVKESMRFVLYHHVDWKRSKGVVVAGRKKVLFVCGSLREKSLNRQVGERAIELIGDAVDTAWLRYDDLPYMNQDREFPVPEAVQRVRDEVAAADALWICSPEYNYGIPGVLKNCIDWLSRPVAPGSAETVLKDKLITFTCAAGGSVGRYVAAALADTLSFVSSNALLTMHAQVALDRQDYTTDVLTLSVEEEKALQTQVRILLERLGSCDEPAC